MADGNAVVAAAGKENATFLLAEHETAWWWRMQSPACGTGARRHGHQICADPDQDENMISVNERKADAATRRCWCPLHRKKHYTPRKKKQLQVWVRHHAAERCHFPPPTTSNECSHELLSGMERGLTLSSGEVRLRPQAPFPRVWSQQTSKARRASNALRLR